MLPDTLAVIGLGAIGGAVARGAHAAGVPRVVGLSSDLHDHVAALHSGAVETVAPTVEEAVADADFVLLAVPPRATVELMEAVARCTSAGAVVTDVASVKAPIMARASEIGLGARFVGGHPLAGTHERGFGAMDPGRLRGAVIYLCRGDAAEEPMARVERFWQHVFQARVVHVDAVVHDRTLAWTSHLPQALSSLLALVLERHGAAPDDLGPGARDVTRLAAGQASLWTDILMQNRADVLQALDASGQALAELRDALVAQDAAALERWLERGAAFRRRLDP
ncbi:MAG: prephenate dehydrogenase [Gemmatimonadota bacterium]